MNLRTIFGDEIADAVLTAKLADNGAILVYEAGSHMPVPCCVVGAGIMVGVEADLTITRHEWSWTVCAWPAEKVAAGLVGKLLRRQLTGAETDTITNAIVHWDAARAVISAAAGETEGLQRAAATTIATWWGAEQA